MHHSASYASTLKPWSLSFKPDAKIGTDLVHLGDYKTAASAKSAAYRHNKKHPLQEASQVITRDRFATLAQKMVEDEFGKNVRQIVTENVYHALIRGAAARVVLMQHSPGKYDDAQELIRRVVSTTEGSQANAYKSCTPREHQLSKGECNGHWLVHPKSLRSIKIGEICRTKELGMIRWVSFDADDNRIGNEFGSRTREQAARRVVEAQKQRVFHEREHKEMR